MKDFVEALVSDWPILLMFLIGMGLIIFFAVMSGNSFGDRCVVEHGFERRSLEWRMCVDRIESGMRAEDVQREILTWRQEQETVS
jgi:hypothetical protein